MPDLRPSIPFNSGPTLFLAPSPMAWQARHLLNDDLPAAASCAIAVEAVAVTVRIISAPKVSFFIGCSSSLPWWVLPDQSLAWSAIVGPPILAWPARLGQATKP